MIRGVHSIARGKIDHCRFVLQSLVPQSRPLLHLSVYQHPAYHLSIVLESKRWSRNLQDAKRDGLLIQKFPITTAHKLLYSDSEAMTLTLAAAAESLY
jgi:hypothetical protein